MQTFRADGRSSLALSLLELLHFPDGGCLASVPESKPPPAKGESGPCWVQREVWSRWQTPWGSRLCQPGVGSPPSSALGLAQARVRMSQEPYVEAHGCSWYLGDLTAQRASLVGSVLCDSCGVAARQSVRPALLQLSECKGRPSGFHRRLGLGRSGMGTMLRISCTSCWRPSAADAAGPGTTLSSSSSSSSLVSCSVAWREAGSLLCRQYLAGRPLERRELPGGGCRDFLQEDGLGPVRGHQSLASVTRTSGGHTQVCCTWRGVCVSHQALPSPAEDFGRPLGPPFHTQTRRFRAS